LKEMMEHITEQIKEADLVLVGIGEEMDLHKQIRTDERYLMAQEMEKDRWMLPFIEKILLREWEEKGREAYQNLAKCLHGKNYFVVSLCLDDAWKGTELNEERIVKPCGGYDKLQCSEKCSSDLYEVPDELLGQIQECLLTGGSRNEVQEPVCPACQKPLVFNNINAANYLEEGYMDKWLIYRKWLQGTVNKKVCILELGAGMKYPTVIRWPFEKIAFFNQKSQMFRVHSRLYQITEEIKERGYGIRQNPVDFLKELSNGF